MFSCFRPAPEPEEQPLIIDVKRIIEERAWKFFGYSVKSYQKRFLRRKDYDIEVPENYFLFEQIEQTVNPLDAAPSTAAEMTPSSGNKNAGVSGSNDLLEGKVPSQRSSNPEAISIDTVFSNDTAKQQTYQFRFEKTRTTSVEVSFQKGFTMGTKANFSIGIPKILGDGSVGLETEMQYEVSKSEGQTFEESMVVEATSNIVVGPKSIYVAKVQFEERSVVVGFKVRTRMSLPQERAPIYIRRKSDNEVICTYKLDILKDVFNKDTAPFAEIVKEKGKEVDHMIDFVIEGVLKGSLAMNHVINLSSDETDEEKRTAKAIQIGSGGEGGGD